MCGSNFAINKARTRGLYCPHLPSLSLLLLSLSPFVFQCDGDDKHQGMQGTGRQPAATVLSAHEPTVLMQRLSHVTKTTHHLVMVLNWTMNHGPRLFYFTLCVVADLWSVLEEH